MREMNPLLQSDTDTSANRLIAYARTQQRNRRNITTSQAADDQGRSSKQQTYRAKNGEASDRAAKMQTNTDMIMRSNTQFPAGIANT